MEPEIIKTDYFLVETRDGDYVVPADLIGRSAVITVETYSDHFRDYIDTRAPIDCVTRKHGYIARLSMPGYLDCTDWSAHDTRAAAEQYLEETYGE